jgi:hypothetical protein
VNRLNFCYSTIFLFIVAGCHPLEQSTPDWSASLTISGGIAGHMTEISLDQTGRAVLLDKRKKTETRKQLSAEDRDRFASQVQALSNSTAGIKPNKQCRDCILYSLVTTYAESQQRWVTDSLGIQSSQARELIQDLTVLATGMSKK